MTGGTASATRVSTPAGGATAARRSPPEAGDAALVADHVFLQVHVTSACNLACRHCYVDPSTVVMSEELFDIVLARFAELVAHLGAPPAWVQVTGGEPLLHPRIWRLLERAAERFPVRLLTNGTLVDEVAASRLGETCTAVQVSLDGLPHTHDAWRGEGSFAATTGALRRLGAAGVSRSVRVSVGADTTDDVLPLVERLEGECELVVVSRVVPTGPCDVTPPDAAAYRPLVYSLYGRRDGSPAVRLGDPFYGPLIATDDPQTRYVGCSAGIGGLCVVEDGTVYPCRRLPWPVGSLPAESLTEIYERAPLLVALRRRALGEPCGSCEDRRVCGGSRCIAGALTGDPLAGDPGCIHRGDTQEVER